MPVVYCICALVALLAAPSFADAQQGSAPPAEGTAGYTVFVRGQPIGREDVTFQRDAAGNTTIVSQSRLGPPINLTSRRTEVRYAADGSARSVTIDAQLGNDVIDLETRFENGVATTKGTEAGMPFDRSEPVSPDTIALPNLMFGVYEAIGRRFASASSGAELRAYVVPRAEITIRLVGVSNQRMQTGTTTFDVRRLELAFVQPPPRSDVAVTLTIDDKGGLVGVNLPAQGLDIVREDVSSPTSRTLLYSNANDEPVIIPVTGFNLGATLTRPRSGAARLPAVILLGDSETSERDGMLAGVPILGQLAGSIADSGTLTVRYDKRGYGQSGGRSESATLSDHAEDARAVFNWLRRRPDVDPDRIAVLGHGEGGWVALLLASRERRLAAVATIATPSTTGAELVLEKQRYLLDRANTPAAERAEKIAQQERINAAVIKGQGWDEISPEVRKQADSPWFQSLLTFDPARVLRDVRQPLLLVHGTLDQQVPVSHAERLAELARKGSRSKAVELVTVRNVNHLLVAATTGHIDEYATLADKTLSPELMNAVSGWLAKTFQAVRD